MLNVFWTISKANANYQWVDYVGPDADSGWISTRQSMTFIRWLTCKSKPIDAKDIDG